MTDPIEYESNEPTCPDCGEEADWIDCKECGGTGLASCICEGMGGEFVCATGCNNMTLTREEIAK
jgi:hypothetical protein